MTQGQKKQLSLRVPNKSRVAKPKKRSYSVKKEYTSGLIRRTEALLGKRAGHMEIIGKMAGQGGQGKASAAGKKLDAALKKGGSKKFG